jgi:hypothetical protein
MRYIGLDGQIELLRQLKRSCETSCEEARILLTNQKNKFDLLETEGFDKIMLDKTYEDYMRISGHLVNYCLEIEAHIIPYLDAQIFYLENSPRNHNY